MGRDQAVEAWLPKELAAACDALASAACAVVSDRLSTVFSIATLLPALAVTMRLRQDVDGNCWMQLIGLIPPVDWIVFNNVRRTDRWT
jgi:uncharacterized membrane protein YhaH (DUF805 family)